MWRERVLKVVLVVVGLTRHGWHLSPDLLFNLARTIFHRRSSGTPF
jgi:hypothetical protein